MLRHSHWVDGKCRQVLLWGLAALLWQGSLAGAAPFRPQAAVLDFQNVSIYTGHLLSRRAADQVALDLGATGSWRVVDRAQTARAEAQRDLRPPYAVGLMQELGHAIGADVVFSGAIQKLEVDAKAGKIRVTLLLEGIDQISGQSLMTTVQTGEAKRDEKSPQPTDVLVGLALAEASGMAAKAATVGTGFIATVTDPGDGKTLQLKPPADLQVKSGQRFLLYRAVPEGEGHVPGKLLAALMIVECKPESCRAQVLAKAGDIHTDDLAVSVCCGQ
jgi:hypothetical protein